MAKTPKNKFFRNFLNAHTRGVKKVFFKGLGWSDGTKIDVFASKMHIFAIFGWFLVQNHKFTNLATFAHCLVAHILIFIHKHLRIKSIFLLILAYFKGTVS